MNKRQLKKRIKKTLRKQNDINVLYEADAILRSGWIHKSWVVEE